VTVRDPRVDDYIARQQPFAKPVLAYIRDVVHEGCPDVKETIKWGVPSFEHHGILCGMAAFRAHLQFGFWKHDLVVGKGAMDGMGFGKFSRIEELPSRTRLVAYVRKATKLNEQGVKAPWMEARAKKASRTRKTPIAVPADFRAALAKTRKAKAVFDGFPPSHKREYLEWITEAKRDATRERRIAQAVEWIAEGKQRNWKYM
jgi:hypothetical protein